GARVRASGFDVATNVGRFHAVAAVDGEHAVRHARHVTIEAARAARLGGVVRVGSDVLSDFFVALGAGAVALHGGRKLPLDVARVHAVAAPTRIAAALETGGLSDTEVFVSGETCRSVRPEALAVELRVFRIDARSVACDGRYVGFELVARAKLR